MSLNFKKYRESATITFNNLSEFISTEKVLYATYCDEKFYIRLDGTFEIVLEFSGLNYKFDDMRDAISYWNKEVLGL